MQIFCSVPSCRRNACSAVTCVFLTYSIIILEDQNRFGAEQSNWSWSPVFTCGRSCSTGIYSRRPKGLVHSSCLFSPPAASSFFSRAEQGRAAARHCRVHFTWVRQLMIKEYYFFAPSRFLLLTLFLDRLSEGSVKRTTWEYRVTGCLAYITWGRKKKEEINQDGFILLCAVNHSST